MASRPFRPTAPEPRRRILILGAAGRDFHDFNQVYRDDPSCEVVAFTASQIPGIAGRRYPAMLAGTLYPDGIPIIDEADLETICRAECIDRVVFAYSDVTHEHVMHVASRALAAGADVALLGPDSTMLASRLPVIAVSAVRTGCGKSQIARWLACRLADRVRRVAVIRHPMPYGDLARQRVQRFASLADLDRADCTAEEREEYEPHIAAGVLVFAGVDYAAVLAAAEREADLIVWDGGNNDFPFLRPSLHIVVADALRPRQAATHHPGEAVARMADILVVNKVSPDRSADAHALADALRDLNPGAPIVFAASPVRLDDPAAVAGRTALVIEDGPTLTHGGMSHGAGLVAAMEAGASEILDARRCARGLVRTALDDYPHIDRVLPALGYNPAQLEALQATVNASGAQVVVSATPCDLARLIRIDLPVVRARYDFAELEEPRLSTLLDAFLHRRQM